MPEPTVAVELFGMARHQAGRAEFTARGRTVGELLRSVGSACPQLAELVTPAGTVSRRYLVSIDGERFVSDPAEVIPAGARVLILGADAGG